MFLNFNSCYKFNNGDFTVNKTKVFSLMMTSYWYSDTCGETYLIHSIDMSIKKCPHQILRLDLLTGTINGFNVDEQFGRCINGLREPHPVPCGHPRHVEDIQKVLHLFISPILKNRVLSALIKLCCNK